MSGGGMTFLRPDEVRDAAVEWAAQVEVLKSRWEAHRAALEGHHEARPWTHDVPGQAFEDGYVDAAVETVDAVDGLLGDTRETATEVGLASMATVDDDEAVADGFHSL